MSKNFYNFMGLGEGSKNGVYIYLGGGGFCKLIRVFVGFLIFLYKFIGKLEISIIDIENLI